MSRYDEELSRGDKESYAAPLQVPREYDERESDNVAWQKHNILTLGWNILTPIF